MNTNNIDCYNSCLNTYLLIGVLWTIYTNNLGCCLKLLVAVLNELFFKASVVFDVSGLINSTLNAPSC